MSNICVPVSVFAPTLNINGNRIAPVWTEAVFNNVFNITKQIWLTARIEFQRSSFTTNLEVELLNPTSASRIIGSDQEYLCRRFRPANGISVVLVNEAESRDRAAGVIGGAAMAVFRGCLLAYSANRRAAGVYLAHEFGHLLGLSDIYTGLGDNLMYGALGTGDAALDGGQRRTALRGARLLIQSPNQPTR